MAFFIYKTGEDHPFEWEMVCLAVPGTTAWEITESPLTHRTMFGL